MHTLAHLHFFVAFVSFAAKMTLGKCLHLCLDEVTFALLSCRNENHFVCESGAEGGMKTSMFLMNEDASELNPL